MSTGIREASVIRTGCQARRLTIAKQATSLPEVRVSFMSRMLRLSDEPRGDMA
jgi:hypothetical protein